MLLWFKDLMNVTEKLKFMDPRFDTPTQCLHQGWSNRLLRQGWIFKEKIPCLSVNVEDVLFWSERFLKTKKKSSSVQCRDPFPILYSGGSVRSLSQLGSDILISFIYLFLSYGKQLKLDLATYNMKLWWRFIKYFFKSYCIQSKHSYSTHMQRAVQ